MKSNNFFPFLCLFILTSFLSYQGFGQEKIDRKMLKDKVKAQKVAYITDQLELTETEAQKFWPIYNNYQSEIESLRHSMDVKFNKNMNDKEAEDLLFSMLEGRSKEIDIQKSYIQKMKAAISVKKIAMLFRAERQFKEKVITKFKERRRGADKFKKETENLGE